MIPGTAIQRRNRLRRNRPGPVTFRLPVAWALTALSVIVLGGRSTPVGAADRIESVVIERVPVFPETTDVPNAWYMDLANRLHVQTRPWVIRRELLIRAGEPADSTRIVESERLLRDRGIFESVRVRLAPGDSGKVAEVRVQDLWTLGIIASFDKTADLTSVTLGIRDTNLLGTGNYIHAYHTFSSDQDQTVASVAIPRIGRGRTGAGFGFADQEDARQRAFSMGRGIETRYDRSSWAVAATSVTGARRFFLRGEEIGESPYEHEHYGVYGARFRGTAPQAGFGIGWIEQREAARDTSVSSAVGFPPPPEAEKIHIGGPSVFIALLDRSYRTAINLDRYGSTEDVPTGWSAHLAVTPNIHHKDDPSRTVAFRSVAQAAQYLGPVLEAGCEISGLAFLRTGGRRGEQRGRATATLRWTPSPRALTIAQGSCRGGRSQPESEPLYLGSESGLRGFPSRELTARSVLQATFEQRFWSGYDVLWTGIGASIFADTARPSVVGRFDDERWRTGWGVGLMLGPRKSSQRPLRIEIAWRTDRHAAPTFSITSGTWLRIIPPLGLLSPIGDLRDGLR
jgi:hypothetical protein